MESAIKISVEVNVNLSQSTQEFVKALFAGAVQNQAPVAKPAPAVQNQAPVAKPAPAAQAPAAPVGKTIEDVRKALAEKINDHRATIKQKLEELGAPSVTKLNPASYDEMYDFLTALK